MYNRILKRPMFKMGGRSYSAQGTGITSGLDTPRRGLVQYPGGYAGEEERLTEIGEEKIQITEPRLSNVDQIIKSFGVYASPYKADGTAKTSGEMGYEQAQNITAERDEQKNLEDLAALSNLEAEEAQIRKDLDRDADQENALEIQQLINSKKIEIDKQYQAVDAKYKLIIDELQAKINDPSLLAPGETVAMVKDAIKKAERQKTEEKYEIARKMPVKPTLAEKIDALALIIYEAKNKNALPGQEYSLEDAKKDAQKYYGQSKAEGGRVGYQAGTGMEGAQPMQASMNMEETISTPNETITEDMSATETIEKQPSVDMTYEEFRSKIPAEVEDNIVQLIYYNKDAFADFASIVDQSGVDEFNNKYQVSLVLPMSDAMV
jgi:hypothetical protein